MWAAKGRFVEMLGLESPSTEAAVAARDSRVGGDLKLNRRYSLTISLVFEYVCARFRVAAGQRTRFSLNA